MRCLIQRVQSASVEIENETVSHIEKGLLLFLGISNQDTTQQIAPMVQKVLNLRVFSNESGHFDHSVKDVEGSLLVV